MQAAVIVEFGHFALILALLVATVQLVVPAFGASLRDERMMRVAEPAAVSQLFLIAIALFALMYAYVTSDFSVANVAANSHSTKPLIYKMSGVWGNHEGSMLLWVLILALFGAAVAVFGNNLPPTLKARVLSVQASIAVAFLLFSLLTSNPFVRLIPAPSDGNGLNPILQDPALSFHPPFLYTGYVGFSIAFSFAIAALIEGRIDAAWARWVRPWTLAAWMFLTIGIAKGSWWAYYEVLGPRRKRVLHAVARGHRTPPFRTRHGEARGAQNLDHPARDPDVLVVVDGHIHRAFRRADFRALVRRRSGTRHLHPRHSDPLFGWRPGALRAAI